MTSFHSITSLARASDFRRHGEAECPCRFKIDDEIEFGRLLDREVGRFRPAQNLIDIVAGAPEQVRVVCSIGHQASRFDELPRREYRRQPRGERLGDDANPVGDHERVATDVERLRAALEQFEGGRDILRSPDFGCGDLKAQCMGSCLNLAHFQHGGGIARIGNDG